MGARGDGHRDNGRYVLNGAADDDDPPDLLATEQAKAVAGLPARDRPPIPTPTGRRAAFLDGYSLRADRLVDEADREGLERLCRYGAREPVVNARLSLDPSGRVVLSLKRPLHDGRTELAFTPIDFLRRLATLIPPPRSHLTRYHGVFAPNHHLRAAIVPAGATAATTTPPCSASPRRLDWASLLKRVFAADGRRPETPVCLLVRDTLRDHDVDPAVQQAWLDHQLALRSQITRDTGSECKDTAAAIPKLAVAAPPDRPIKLGRK